MSKILKFFLTVKTIALIKWRSFWARQIFGAFGKHSSIYGRVISYSPENIFIGKNCTLNEGCILNARAKIIIGDFVRLSPSVQIHTGFLNLNQCPEKRGHLSKPVKIENGVWLASGAIINAGVTIGENSVVAAGAVVTKDVPPNTLMGGVPARFIKKLNL